ncbi:hypothetical protein PG987_006230 [Apiospora arundinis]
MEALGAAAAIAQLAGYSHSTVKILVELLEHMRTGSSVYQERIYEIEALREVIESLPRSTQAQSSIDSVVRSIVQISRDALSTLNSLRTKPCLFGTVLWAYSERSRVSKCFNSLESKKKDLVLYLVYDQSHILKSIDNRFQAVYPARKMPDNPNFRSDQTPDMGRTKNNLLAREQPDPRGALNIGTNGHIDKESAIRSTAVATDAVKDVLSSSKDVNIRTENGQLSGEAVDLAGIRDKDEVLNIVKAKIKPPNTGESPPEGSSQPTPFKGDGCQLQASPSGPKLTPKEAVRHGTLVRDPQKHRQQQQQQQQEDEEDDLVLVQSMTSSGTRGRIN